VEKEREEEMAIAARLAVQTAIPAVLAARGVAAAAPVTKSGKRKRWVCNLLGSLRLRLLLPRQRQRPASDGDSVPSARIGRSKQTGGE